MVKTLYILILFISLAVVNVVTAKKRICIVGAGISGLVTAKYFGEYPDEFEPIVYEKNSDVGGLWIYTDSTTVDEHGLPVHSSSYKNLRTNNVKSLVTFPDYPELGDESSDGRFLKRDIVLEYLRNYTNYFGLRSYIRFDTNVEKIKPLSRLGWLMVTRNLNTQKTSTTICDAVAVCNGHTFKEHIPKIQGIESFPGQILHSHVYRKPEAFANQTVLVLGASYSGIDIANDISSQAQKVYLSHRYDKLSGRFPSNLEQIPTVISVEGSELVLSNGTRLQADVFLYCTGYAYDYPFLDQSSGIVVKGGKHIHWLYKHIINVERPTMAFIDVPYRALHFQLVHVQASYFREVLRGNLKLPSREKMLFEARRQLKNTAPDKGHITSSFDEFLKYYDDLALEVRGKRLPWWFNQHLRALFELQSKDHVHDKDRRFIVHEGNRTVEFV